MRTAKTPIVRFCLLAVLVLATAVCAFAEFIDSRIIAAGKSAEMKIAIFGRLPSGIGLICSWEFISPQGRNFLDMRG